MHTSLCKMKENRKLYTCLILLQFCTSKMFGFILSSLSLSTYFSSRKYAISISSGDSKSKNFTIQYCLIIIIYCINSLVYFVLYIHAKCVGGILKNRLYPIYFIRGKVDIHLKSEGYCNGGIKYKE